VLDCTVAVPTGTANGLQETIRPRAASERAGVADTEFDHRPTLNPTNLIALITALLHSTGFRTILPFESFGYCCSTHERAQARSRSAALPRRALPE
jgi:hypothetical protein